MDIVLKRVYEPWDEEDGFRVLVDRRWPRGVSRVEARIDLWPRDAAPSLELCDWFNHNLSRWDEFEERYTAELAESGDILRELQEAVADKDRVTLVYAGRDEKCNQAVVLRAVLSQQQG